MDDYLPLQPSVNPPSEKTLTQALLSIWQKQESTVSPYYKAAYYSALAISLGAAVPSGYPYWPIGKKLLTTIFQQDIKNLYVKIDAYFLGGSSALVNSLFNVWVMNRYMKMFMPVSAERNIINRSDRNWKTCTKLILLHIEAMAAVIAMGYVSLEEENYKIDFWVVDSILIGFFVAYANLDPFVDSVIWLLQKIHEKLCCSAQKEKNLTQAIKQYFSALHKMNHAQKFKFKGLKKISREYIDQESDLTWRDIAPYVVGGGLAAGTFMGRWGIIKKSYEAARLITTQFNLAPGTDFFSAVHYFITGLAILPPIGFGIKTANTFGVSLFNAFSRLCGSKVHHESSVAVQTYPYLTLSFLLLMFLPVLGSFGGNAYLTMEALNETFTRTEIDSYIEWEFIYYLVASAIGPILSNGFGVYSLIQDVIGQLASTDEAIEERFFVDYELLLSKALKGDDKSAIELLFYLPELIPHLEDFGMNEQSIIKIVKRVVFTDAEKQKMMEQKVRENNSLLIDEKNFDESFKKIFQLENEVQLDSANSFGTKALRINGPHSGQHDSQSKLLANSKAGLFLWCCGCDDEGSGNDETRTFNNNTSYRRI